VLLITEDILFGWRLIIEKGRQRCYTFSHPGVLIAASAAHYGLTVVTRNVRGFVEAGVAVIDPWTGPRTKLVVDYHGSLLSAWRRARRIGACAGFR
jgi:hypothetical protein